MIRPQPNDALREILSRTGELDAILDGRGLDFSGNAPNPPAPPPGRPLIIEPPPWSDHYQPELDPDATEENRP